MAANRRTRGVQVPDLANFAALEAQMGYYRSCSAGRPGGGIGREVCAGKGHHATGLPVGTNGEGIVKFMQKIARSV